MLECEIKFRFGSARAASLILSGAGVDMSPPGAEENAVLDAPDGSLSARGILLRIRSAAGRTLLTVKTPVENGRMKVRRELETFVECAPSALEEMFAALGLPAARRYSKTRSIGRLGDATVCLDILYFGTFIEIEAPSPESLELAVGRLGLDIADGLKENYLELEDEERTGAGG